MLTPEQMRIRALDNKILSLNKKIDELNDTNNKLISVINYLKGGWVETLNVFARHGKMSYSDKCKILELAKEIEQS